MEDNDVWMDAGTFESLLMLEITFLLYKEPGRLYGSPELAAYNQGFLSMEHLKNLVKNSPKNSYYSLLEKLLFKVKIKLNPNLNIRYYYVWQSYIPISYNHILLKMFKLSEINLTVY